MIRPTPTGRAHGFSIIELLVALIVVSLGLGGILYSHARGMQALNGNSWRAQAAVLAEHVIERARANPGVAYTIDFGETRTGSAVVDRDLALWKTQLGRTLPSGDGRITTTRVTDTASGQAFDRVDVTVSWDDQRAGVNPSAGTQIRYLRIQAFRTALP